MARPTLNLKISLDNVHCFDEGDGPGNAEPYLWSVFFKIDGDNYAVETGSGLIGFPVIFSTNGHHGNLNNTDVDEGDDVPVPESIGVFESTLKPIPVNDPFIKSLVGDDLPGICGVVLVLMEEDGWPGDLADTGYTTLINAVTLAVGKVAAGFQHATHAPTKEEIDAAIKTVKDTAATMVHDAVEGVMSGWQLIWYGTFGNNDDTVGSEAFTFTHDDFAADAVINFSRHWDEDEAGDGDWEISGTATGVVPCPAGAFSDLFGGIGGGARAKDPASGSTKDPHSRSLTAMHAFRAKEYAALPGLEPWWRALQQGVPDLIRIVAGNPKLRASAKRLFDAVPDVLAAPDKPLPEEHWKDLMAIMEQLSQKSRPLNKSLARQALTIIPKLHGKTWKAALQHVAGIPISTSKEEKKPRKPKK